MDPLVAQLAVPQAADRIVFVKTLLGAGRRLHMPFQERPVQRGGDLFRQNGLSGSRLALHQ